MVKVGDQVAFRTNSSQRFVRDESVGYHFDVVGTVIKVMRKYALVERVRRWKVPIEELTVIDG